MRIAIVILAAWLLVNVLAFHAFWTDKNAARLGNRRTPERTLLGLAALGGSLGAIAGQQLFRHKTRKEPFRTRLIVIAGVQYAACMVAIGYVLAMALTGPFSTALAALSAE
jgi:uncharacterized membrane protein YsdA (DUF1294 family)